MGQEDGATCESDSLTDVHLVKAMVFPVVVYVWELDHKEGLSAKELMLLNCDAGEDF